MTVTQNGSVYGLQTAGRTADVVAAERAVLGSCIDTGSTIPARQAAEAVTEILPSEDCFADTTHQAVYSAVRYLAEAGEPTTAAAVLERLVSTEHGVWRTGQAGVILAGLTEHATPLWENAARAVQRAAIRRRGIAAMQTGIQMLAEAGDLDFGEVPDRIRSLLDDALNVTGPGNDLATAGDLYLQAAERIQSGRPPGTVQLPWYDMQLLVPYLRPGQLVSVLARPSLGKSLCGLDIARHIGMVQKLPVILFTMEQDRDEVTDRLLSAEASVQLHEITTSKVDEAGWERISHVADQFLDSKLTVDDTPKITLSHIRARLRGMARTEAAQAAIVDYLQLMDGAAGENRQREVAALVGGLKAIAREFRIPVIMLCQLNRGPESRHDKRPYMSDARESGSVENDSDVAILIHRPDFYDSESNRAGEADLIVDKNRNGPRATVTVGFQGHYARFVDLARRNWNPSSALEDS